MVDEPAPIAELQADSAELQLAREPTYSVNDTQQAALAPTVVADPPWYHAKNGQERGPVPFSQLQLLAATGNLLADDLVWSDGMIEWVAASQVPGLFAASAQSFSIINAGPPNALKGSTPSAVGISPTEVQRVTPMSVACLVLSLIAVNILYLLPISLAKRAYSLVGVSVFLFFAAVLAVVFGHVAMRQIKQSAGALSGGGMSIAGLILGYFVIIAVTVVSIVVGFIVLLGGSIALLGGTPAN